MDALARAALRTPQAPALVTAGGTVSYQELDRAAWGVADLVAASGSLGRHAVAFWGERTAEAVAAVWGIPRAGVAAVPVDPRVAPAAAMAATRAAGVRGLWAPPDGGIASLAARGGDTSGEVGDPAGYVVFTSGSEGRPKGVRITQGNVAAAVAGSHQRLGHGPQHSWLCVLPLFHVGGLAILWRQAESAAPVVLHERFEPERAARALGEVGFASFVPVMLRRILAACPRFDPGPLEAVLVGGAASDRALLQQARTAGLPAVPTYGMTETTSQVATPAPSEPLDGTVGRPLPGAEIRVVTEGRPVTGRQGRIEVRGPMVSPGYVGEPDRDPGGWFTTADLGMIDSAGRLAVTGRADQMIVTGGENVHPAVVEAALLEIPGVGDVRVRGLPDDEWGQVVVAEVVTSLSEPELVAVAGRLPPAMRPRRWEIVSRIGRKLDE